MKFCRTEVVNSKEKDDRHITYLDFPEIVELRLLYFVLQSIKKGADDISIIVRDLNTSFHNNLTLTCNTTLDRKNLATIVGIFAPLTVRIDNTHTRSKYYYHLLDKTDGKQTFNKTKISEAPTEGSPYTQLDGANFISVKGQLTKFGREIYINSVILSKVLEFLTAYLELTPDKTPNISLIVYPYKENNDYKCVQIKRLGLLNTKRHHQNLFGKYVVDYFFMPRRRGVKHLNNNSFIVRKKGYDLFQLQDEDYPSLTGDILSNNIEYMKFRKDPDTSGIVTVISEKD